MFRHILRVSVTKKIIRNFTTYSGAKDVLESGWKSITGNLIFIRIHGCTADETIKGLDLENKTCLITGANSGIGLEMTKCLSARGCTVLMACRNSYVASGIIKNIGEDGKHLRFYETNLASLTSVKTSSEEIMKNEKKIDIVILNAAVFGLPWTLTEDGLETTFQVNYLSQYYLLMNIEKMLAADARVVFISTESHRYVNWTINNILAPTEEMLSLPKENYTSIRAYNISKLCGILTMHYLGYRWLHSGKQVFCANPGSFIKTRLSRNWWVYEALYTAMWPFSKSISQAASTPLFCATSPDLKGFTTAYFKNFQRFEESELAQDLQLSFRIQDLTRDIIRARVAADDEVSPRISESPDYQERPKATLDDTLISNYSNT